MCWAYIGQFFIVLSLAEMAAMAPTAGGQYHWVSEFAPRKHQKILSYISGMYSTYSHCWLRVARQHSHHLGWLSAVSWQSIIAIDSYIVGVMIQGIIVLNDATYVPTRWQGTLLIIASVIGIGLFNVFAAKHLPLAEGVFVTFHVFAFF